MPEKQHLFAVTELVLKAAMAFSVSLAALLGLGLGALCVAAINPDGNHFGIPAVMAGIPRIEALEIGAFAIAGILICVVLAFFTFRATAAIIATAMSGDPFVVENARRLTTVGWLLTAFMMVQLLTNRMVHGLMAHLAANHHLTPTELGHFDFGSGLSPVGLLAVLLIFVLGQIFRRGSEMRAELEGTV